MNWTIRNVLHMSSRTQNTINLVRCAIPSRHRITCSFVCNFAHISTQQKTMCSKDFREFIALFLCISIEFYSIWTEHHNTKSTCRRKLKKNVWAMTSAVFKVFLERFQKIPTSFSRNESATKQMKDAFNRQKERESKRKFIYIRMRWFVFKIRCVELDV